MHVVPGKLTTGDPLSVEDLLRYFPALKEVSPALVKQYALGAAVRRNFRAGEVVCEEGEFGSTAFYVVEGSVEIYIGNPISHLKTKPRGGGRFAATVQRMTSMLVAEVADARASIEQFITIDASIDLSRTTPIATLGPGELIGEMSCRTFQPRSATVRALENCVVVEMLRVILDMLVGTRDVDPTTKATTKVKAPTFKGTSFRKQMDEQYRARSLATHLRSVPLFARLDEEFFNYIKEHAELVSYSKGEVVCSQGEAAEAFYLIRNGLVRVSQKMPFVAGERREYLADKATGKEFWFSPEGEPVDDELVRTYLKRGEFFGEIGLLYEQARNATCSALDAVDLVKIRKEDFQLLLERSPAVRSTLEEIARGRMESDREKKLPVGLQLVEFIDQGLFEAQNLLLIDLDNCTRCDACVNACADAHDGVTRLIRDGLRYDRFLVATACRSCRDPLCMTQCPVGSIRRKESLEIIIEDWCIGCTKCAELCPYGNINMHGFDVMKEVPAAVKKEAASPAKSPGTVAAEVKSEVASGQAIPAAGAAANDPTGEPNSESVPTTPKLPEPKPAPKPAAPTAPRKMERKMVTVQKATTCDLCTQLSVPSCVYACPHDAAKRVEPTEFLARQIGSGDHEKRRYRWLNRPVDRTTH